MKVDATAVLSRGQVIPGFRGRAFRQVALHQGLIRSRRKDTLTAGGRTGNRTRARERESASTRGADCRKRETRGKPRTGGRGTGTDGGEMAQRSRQIARARITGTFTRGCLHATGEEQIRVSI